MWRNAVTHSVFDVWLTLGVGAVVLIFIGWCAYKLIKG